jgi:hypothetical protein
LELTQQCDDGEIGTSFHNSFNPVMGITQIHSLVAIRVRRGLCIRPVNVQLQKNGRLHNSGYA